MERQRTIAGSPVRSSAETWLTITDLAVVSLAKSPSIDGNTVRREFEKVAPAGTALVAGDYLTGKRLTIVAGLLYLHVAVVSGAGAFEAATGERPEAVPGAATADTWSVFVDPPGALATTIAEVFALSPNFVAEVAPPEGATNARAAIGAVPVDLDAFSRMKL